MDFLYNVTNSTTTIDLLTVGNNSLDDSSNYSIYRIADGGSLSLFEYTAVIAILAVFVFMAIVFTIYGLFMKAEAHKHSAVDVIGFEGHKESLMFSDRESYSPWHSDFDSTWP